MDQYQTVIPRTVAAVIDHYIIRSAQMLFFWLVGADLATPISLVCAFIVSVLPVSYMVYMHGRFGQTLGKYICGVKVLALNGARITYEQAIRRDIVPCLLLPVWVWTTGYLAIYRVYPPSIMFRWALYIGIYWTLLEIITMLFNEQRRAIHDFIARTVVVRVP